MEFIKLDPKKIIVTYRYTIPQPPVARDLYSSIKSWEEKLLRFMTTNGIALLVSPICNYERNILLIQPHLDLDTVIKTKEQVKVLKDVCQEFDLYPVFTGKRGFHLFCKHINMVDILRLNDRSHKNIINTAFQSKLNKIIYILEKQKIKVDLANSTTHQQNPRIGWRADTRKFIFPLLDDNFLNIDFISSIHSINDITGIVPNNYLSIIIPYDRVKLV